MLVGPEFNFQQKEIKYVYGHEEETLVYMQTKADHMVPVGSWQDLIQLNINSYYFPALL